MWNHAERTSPDRKPCHSLSTLPAPFPVWRHDKNGNLLWSIWGKKRNAEWNDKQLREEEMNTDFFLQGGGGGGGDGEGQGVRWRTDKG